MNVTNDEAVRLLSEEVRAAGKSPNGVHHLAIFLVLVLLFGVIGAPELAAQPPQDPPPGRGEVSQVPPGPPIPPLPERAAVSERPPGPPIPLPSPPADIVRSEGQSVPNRTDDELVAEGLGATVVKANHEFGDRFDTIVREELLPLGVVAEYRVDEGVALSGEIYFVGEVPESALVALDGLDIKMQGGATLSLAEQRLVTQYVSQAMHVYKPQNALVGADRDGVSVQVDEVEFSQEQVEALRLSAIEQTRLALSENGYAAAAERLDASGFRFERVPRSELPRPRSSQVYGGQTLISFDSSAGAWQYCTAGLPVAHPNYAFEGMTTAGHCVADQASAYIWDGTQWTYWRAAYSTGDGGSNSTVNVDLARLYPTGTVDVLPQFQASGWNRDIHSYTDGHAGRPVCIEGISSSRRCSGVRIVDFGNYWWVDGVLYTDMTRITNGVMQDGDSGGPVSYNNTVFGIYAGDNGYYGYITSASKITSNTLYVPCTIYNLGCALV